jgi:hypothetical protein
MDHLTDAELVATLRQAEDTTAAEAAIALGISTRALRERKALAKARGLTAESAVLDPLDKAKAKIARLEADNKGLTRAALSAEQVRQEIYGLSNAVPEPPKWMLSAARNIKTPGVPMTLWSDWHWGEVVNPAEVGGVNRYDMATAQDRVRELVKRTVLLAKHHMVRPVYPGIVVCLGGDMITGAIHEELALTNWGTVQEQFLQVQEALIWGLTQMADTFGKVFVPCVVGNHGRNTIKSHMKGRVFQNYEWNLYQQIERHFRKDKRLRFLIPNETDAFFTVYDHRFLLTHGDTLGVKGGDGIIGAIGPITRGTFKVGRSEAQIGRDFDTLLMGHWHTYIPRGDAVPAIVNGSLIGYNEYARLGLRVPYGRPSQALWFVHPDHGITAQWQVWVDEKHRSNEGAEWLSWQTRQAA